MDSSISITLNRGYPDEQGKPTYAVKIQGRDWEMNVWMTEAELALIPDVRAARWSECGGLKIGSCQNNPAFWSCENGHLSILVGDPESWDFGVMIPEAELDNIVAEIENQKKSEDDYFDKNWGNRKDV